MTDTTTDGSGDVPTVIVDALATYTAISSPTLTDVQTFVAAVLTAVDSGLVTSDNILSTMDVLLNILYSAGLTESDYETFYTIINNAATDSVTLGELQSLIFAFALDTISTSESNSDIISSTTMPLSSALSSVLIVSLEALFTNSSFSAADNSTISTQMTSLATSMGTDGGLTQTVIDTAVSNITTYLSDQGVDSTTITDLEDKYILTLSAYQDLNYSNFATAIWTQDAALDEIEAFQNESAYGDSTVRSNVGTSAPTFYQDNQLTTGDITGAGFLATIVSTINYYSDSWTDTQTGDVTNYFSQIFADYADNATWGTTLTLDLPSANTYSSAETTNFDISLLELSDEYVKELIITPLDTAYQPIIDLLMNDNEAGIESTASLAASITNTFTAYYESLGSPATMSYTQLSGFTDAISTEYSALYPNESTTVEFSSTQISTLQSMYTQEVLSTISAYQQYYLSNIVYNTTSTDPATVIVQGDATSISIINDGNNLYTNMATSMTQSTALSAEDKAQILYLLEQLVMVNNLTQNGINGWSYMQICIEMLQFMSGYLGQDDLDTAATDLWDLMVLFPTYGTEFSTQGDTGTAESTSSQPAQLSTMMQLSIVLGVAGLILGIGFSVIIEVVGVALVEVGLAVTANAAATATAEATGIAASVLLPIYDAVPAATTVSSAVATADAAAVTITDITATTISSLIQVGSNALAAAGEGTIIGVESGSVAATTLADAITAEATALGVDSAEALSAVTAALTSAEAAGISSADFLAAATGIVDNSFSIVVLAEATSSGLSSTVIAAGLEASLGANALVDVEAVATTAGVDSTALLGAITSAGSSAISTGISTTAFSAAALSMVESTAGITTAALTTAITEATTDTISASVAALGVQAAVNASGASVLIGTLDATATTAVEAIAASAGVTAEDLIDAVNTIGLTVADTVDDTTTAVDTAIALLVSNVTTSTVEDAAGITASAVTTAVSSAADTAGVDASVVAQVLNQLVGASSADTVTALTTLADTTVSATTDATTSLSTQISTITGITDETMLSDLATSITSLSTSILDTVGTTTNVTSTALAAVIDTATLQITEVSAGITTDAMSTAITDAMSTAISTADTGSITAVSVAKGLQMAITEGVTLSAALTDSATTTISTISTTLATDLNVDATVLNSALTSAAGSIAETTGGDSVDYALTVIIDNALSAAVEAGDATAEASMSSSLIDEFTTISNVLVTSTNDNITQATYSLTDVITNLDTASTTSLANAGTGLQSAITNVSTVFGDADAVADADTLANTQTLASSIQSLYTSLTSATDTISADLTSALRALTILANVSTGDGATLAETAISAAATAADLTSVQLAAGVETALAASTDFAATGTLDTTAEAAVTALADTLDIDEDTFIVAVESAATNAEVDSSSLLSGVQSVIAGNLSNSTLTDAFTTISTVTASETDSNILAATESLTTVVIDLDTNSTASLADAATQLQSAITSVTSAFDGATDSVLENAGTLTTSMQTLFAYFEEVGATVPDGLEESLADLTALSSEDVAEEAAEETITDVVDADVTVDTVSTSGTALQAATSSLESLTADGSVVDATDLQTAVDGVTTAIQNLLSETAELSSSALTASSEDSTALINSLNLYVENAASEVNAAGKLGATTTDAISELSEVLGDTQAMISAISDDTVTAATEQGLSAARSGVTQALADANSAFIFEENLATLAEDITSVSTDAADTNLTTASDTLSTVMTNVSSGSYSDAVTNLQSAIGNISDALSEGTVTSDAQQMAASCRLLFTQLVMASSDSITSDLVTAFTDLLSDAGLPSLDTLNGVSAQGFDLLMQVSNDSVLAALDNMQIVMEGLMTYSTDSITSVWTNFQDAITNLSAAFTDMTSTADDLSVVDLVSEAYSLMPAASDDIVTAFNNLMLLSQITDQSDMLTTISSAVTTGLADATDTATLDAASDMSTLITNLTSGSPDLATTVDDFTTLISDVSALDQTDSYVQVLTENIKTLFTTLDLNLDSAEDLFSAYNTFVSSLSEDEVADTFTSLLASSDTLDTAIAAGDSDTIVTTLATMNTDISTVVGDIQTALDELGEEATVTEVRETIGSSYNQLAEFMYEVQTGLFDQFSSGALNIDLTSVVDNVNEIKALGESIQTVLTEIASTDTADATSIESLESVIADNQEDIAEIEQEVNRAAVLTNISDNLNAIDATTTSASIESAVSNLTVAATFLSSDSMDVSLAAQYLETAINDTIAGYAEDADDGLSLLSSISETFNALPSLPEADTLSLWEAYDSLLSTIDSSTFSSVDSADKIMIAQSIAEGYQQAASNLANIVSVTSPEEAAVQTALTDLSDMMQNANNYLYSFDADTITSNADQAAAIANSLTRASSTASNAIEVASALVDDTGAALIDTTSSVPTVLIAELNAISESIVEQLALGIEEGTVVYVSDTAGAIVNVITSAADSLDVSVEQVAQGLQAAESALEDAGLDSLATVAQQTTTTDEVTTAITTAVDTLATTLNVNSSVLVSAVQTVLDEITEVADAVSLDLALQNVIEQGIEDGTIALSSTGEIIQNESVLGAAITSAATTDVTSEQISLGLEAALKALQTAALDVSAATADDSAILISTAVDTVATNLGVDSSTLLTAVESVLDSITDVEDIDSLLYEVQGIIVEDINTLAMVYEDAIETLLSSVQSSADDTTIAANASSVTTYIESTQSVVTNASSLTGAYAQGFAEDASLFIAKLADAGALLPADSTSISSVTAASTALTDLSNSVAETAVQSALDMALTDADAIDESTLAEALLKVLSVTDVATFSADIDTVAAASGVDTDSLMNAVNSSMSALGSIDNSLLVPTLSSLIESYSDAATIDLITGLNTDLGTASDAYLDILANLTSEDFTTVDSSLTALNSTMTDFLESLGTIVDNAATLSDVSTDLGTSLVSLESELGTLNSGLAEVETEIFNAGGADVDSSTQNFTKVVMSYLLDYQTQLQSILEDLSLEDAATSADVTTSADVGAEVDESVSSIIQSYIDGGAGGFLNQVTDELGDIAEGSESVYIEEAAERVETIAGDFGGVLAQAVGEDGTVMTMDDLLPDIQAVVEDIEAGFAEDASSARSLVEALSGVVDVFTSLPADGTIAGFSETAVEALGENMDALMDLYVESQETESLVSSLLADVDTSVVAGLQAASEALSDAGLEGITESVAEGSNADTISAAVDNVATNLDIDSATLEADVTDVVQGAIDAGVSSDDLSTGVTDALKAVVSYSIDTAITAAGTDSELTVAIVAAGLQSGTDSTTLATAAGVDQAMLASAVNAVTASIGDATLTASAAADIFVSSVTESSEVVALNSASTSLSQLLSATEVDVEAMTLAVGNISTAAENLVSVIEAASTLISYFPDATTDTLAGSLEMDILSPSAFLAQSAEKGVDTAAAVTQIQAAIDSAGTIFGITGEATVEAAAGVISESFAEGLSDISTDAAALSTSTSNTSLSTAATNITTIISDLSTDTPASLSDAVTQFQSAITNATDALSDTTVTSDVRQVTAYLRTLYSQLQVQGVITEDITIEFSALLDSTGIPSNSSLTNFTNSAVSISEATTNTSLQEAASNVTALLGDFQTYSADSLTDAATQFQSAMTNTTTAVSDDTALVGVQNMTQMLQNIYDVMDASTDLVTDDITSSLNTLVNLTNNTAITNSQATFVGANAIAEDIPYSLTAGMDITDQMSTLNIYLSNIVSNNTLVSGSVSDLSATAVTSDLGNNFINLSTWGNTLSTNFTAIQTALTAAGDAVDASTLSMFSDMTEELTGTQGDLATVMDDLSITSTTEVDTTALGEIELNTLSLAEDIEPTVDAAAENLATSQTTMQDAAASAADTASTAQAAAQTGAQTALGIDTGVDNATNLANLQTVLTTNADAVTNTTWTDAITYSQSAIEGLQNSASGIDVGAELQSAALSVSALQALEVAETTADVVSADLITLLKNILTSVAMSALITTYNIEGVTSDIIDVIVAATDGTLSTIDQAAIAALVNVILSGPMSVITIWQSGAILLANYVNTEDVPTVQASVDGLNTTSQDVSDSMDKITPDVITYASTAVSTYISSLNSSITELEELLTLAESAGATDTDSLMTLLEEMSAKALVISSELSGTTDTDDTDTDSTS